MRRQHHRVSETRGVGPAPSPALTVHPLPPSRTVDTEGKTLAGPVCGSGAAVNPYLAEVEPATSGDARRLRETAEQLTGDSVEQRRQAQQAAQQ